MQYLASGTWAGPGTRPDNAQLFLFDIAHARKLPLEAHLCHSPWVWTTTPARSSTPGTIAAGSPRAAMPGSQRSNMQIPNPATPQPRHQLSELLRHPARHRVRLGTGPSGLVRCSRQRPDSGLGELAMRRTPHHGTRNVFNPYRLRLQRRHPVHGSRGYCRSRLTRNVSFTFRFVWNATVEFLITTTGHQITYPSNLQTPTTRRTHPKISASPITWVSRLRHGVAYSMAQRISSA